MSDTESKPKTEYALRLERALELKGATVRQLAVAINATPQALYKVLNGFSKGLSAENTMKAAKWLGVQPMWLSDGTEPMTPPRVIDLDRSEEYPSVKRVDLRFSAGVTGYEVSQLQDDRAPIVFRADWFRAHGYRPERLIAVRVEGSSMEPTLWHDDIIVINLDDTTPRDGHVFGIRYEDQLVVKRLFREGGWIMRSDNADRSRYPDRACSESVQVIGRVVYRQSERL